MRKMRTIHTLACSLFLILLASSFALSQGTRAPLAGNASLDETKAWLVNAIRENASYKVVSEPKSKIDSSGAFSQKRTESAEVKEVSFDGCKLSYAIRYSSSIHSFSNYVVRPVDNYGYSPSPVSGLNKTRLQKVSFDLRDIDAESLRSAPPTQSSGIPAIVLFAADKKDAVIASGLGGTSLDDRKERSYRFAMLRVNKDSVEPIRSAFAQAITICRNL